MKAMLIAIGEAPRDIDIPKDPKGSALTALQALVGGPIEAFDVLFGEDICIYVNEEGLYSLPPNRAIYATPAMAEAGYLSQMDYATPVRGGDLYTILFGNLVAVGFDMETGEDRDLTAAEAEKISSYFTHISPPNSGVLEARAIVYGKEDYNTYAARHADACVTLDTEADNARDAASQKVHAPDATVRPR